MVRDEVILLQSSMFWLPSKKPFAEPCGQVFAATVAACMAGSWIGMDLP
ncbi:hypothetical protein ALSL_0425 [Aerosticca soli]|jgi:hypothetical protein|uniref:Uncharacterized protein n=1 Tax=Aerosticca soli TaxID=2010829 RepID=A0A2Z6E214_9GAMM|nr:hypothetical protein ALSL_0425 [Aerosticca soli]